MPSFAVISLSFDTRSVPTTSVYPSFCGIRLEDAEGIPAGRRWLNAAKTTGTPLSLHRFPTPEELCSPEAFSTPRLVHSLPLDIES
jgi:hypothetical protein